MTFESEKKTLHPAPHAAEDPRLTSCLRIILFQDSPDDFLFFGGKLREHLQTAGGDRHRVASSQIVSGDFAVSPDEAVVAEIHIEAPPLRDAAHQSI